MIDVTIYAPIGAAFLIILIYHFFTKSKVKRLHMTIGDQTTKIQMQSKMLIQKKQKISELEKKLSEKEAVKPSKELADFMLDLKTNGYGVVRIDPDSIFYRGTR